MKKMGQIAGLLVGNFLVFLLLGTVLDNLGVNVISGEGFQNLVLASLILTIASIAIFFKKSVKKLDE